MLPEIAEIARRRKTLGIKQKELAKLANVSQSFIAKLESGKINPSYENTKRILEVLESKEHENQVIAGQIMNRKIIYVHGNDRVSKAISLMKRYGISQLPVFDNSKHIGSITDKGILDKIAEEGDIKNLINRNISDVMGEAFPQIPEKTPLSSITMLLRHNQSLLVSRGGKPVGIISKADLLNIKAG